LPWFSSSISLCVLSLGWREKKKKSDIFSIAEGEEGKEGFCLLIEVYYHWYVIRSYYSLKKKGGRK